MTKMNKQQLAAKQAAVVKLIEANPVISFEGAELVTRRFGDANVMGDARSCPSPVTVFAGALERARGVVTVTACVGWFEPSLAGLSVAEWESSFVGAS